MAAPGPGRRRGSRGPSPAPSSRCSTDLHDGRARRLRRGRLAARRAPRSRRPPTGTWPRTPPERLVALLPRRRLREPVRHGGGPPRRRGLRDHDLPDRARVRGLPATAPRGVRRPTSRRPRPARLHRERDRLGPGRPGPRPDGLVDPFGGLADLGGAGPARRGRPRRPVPRGRAADGPRGPAGGDPGVRDRARDARRDRAPTPRSSRHLSGERIGAELEKLLAAPRAVGRAAPRRRRRACSAVDLAGPRGAARHPPEQGRRARTSGTTRCGRSMPRPPRARSCAWRRSSTTSASRRTLADGHFHHHDVVGRAPRRRLPAPPAVPARGRGGRRPPRAPPHVRRGPDALGRRRAPVPQARRRPPPRQPVRAAAGGRHRVRAWRPTILRHRRVPSAHRRGARGGGRARPLRPRRGRRRPHARARAWSRGRGWGG